MSHVQGLTLGTLCASSAKDGSIMIATLKAHLTRNYNAIVICLSVLLWFMMLHSLSSGSTMPTTYKETWKTSYPWVEPVSHNRLSARCKWCKTSIDVSSMGASALRNHSTVKKHKDLAAVVMNSQQLGFTPKSTSTAPTSTAPTSTAPVQKASNTATVETRTDHAEVKSKNPFNKEAVTRAELIWIYRLVDSNHSFSSNNNVSQTLKQMFPDSVIAENFKLCETKSQYVLNFALAPLSDMVLKRSISESTPGYVILFDESLNNDLQKKQLDFHVRIWNFTKGIVETRYYTSQYLGKAASADLVNSFKKLDINLQHMIQIGQDGPNVNLSAYKVLVDHMRQSYGVGLLNVGTCGLHTLHNAFKGSFTGDTSAKRARGCDWKIGTFLRALDTLFTDCPARRVDYEKINKYSDGSGGMYPLSFCAHRWVENVTPAERAIEMIEPLQKFVAEAEKGNVTKPTCPSYKTVKDFILDSMAVGKLMFFYFNGQTYRRFSYEVSK